MKKLLLCLMLVIVMVSILLPTVAQAASPSVTIRCYNGGGSASSSHRTAAEGTKVTIKPVPDEGYGVSEIKVTDRYGPLEISGPDENGWYTFVMTNQDAEVKIEFAKHVTSIDLNKSTCTLKPGETQDLVVYYTPFTHLPTDLKWTSDNNSVATVDNNGTVTAVGAGTATIQVTTVDGNKTATCVVTVPAAYDITLAHPGGSTTGGNYSVNKNLAIEGEKITVEVAPEDGYVTTIAAFAMLSPGSGYGLTIQRIDDDTYQFTMPSCPVKVDVSFFQPELSVTCGEKIFHADSLEEAFEIANEQPSGTPVIIKVERDYVELGSATSFANYASVTLDLNGHHVYFEDTFWINTPTSPASNDYQNKVGSVWIDQQCEEGSTTGEIFLTDSSAEKTGFIHAMVEVMYGKLRIDSGTYYGVVFPADTKISGGTFLGMPQEIIDQAPDSLYEKWIGSISAFPASVYYPGYQDENSARLAMEGIIADGFIANKNVVASKSPGGSWLAGLPANTTVVKAHTVTVTATEGGTVTGGGVYEYGTDVTLTATPNDGYKFVNWTQNGVEVSTSVTYSFEATADCTPVANFAPTAIYDLWVGGVQVTSANLVIDSVDNGAISGSATFDPETGTLTLDNFSCSSDVFGGVIDILDGDITIKLKGNNTLTSTGEYTYGIYTTGNLVICNGEDGVAQGQLTINTVNYCINAYTSTLEINGVKVVATSTGGAGLSAESISLSGATLSAIGGGSMDVIGQSISVENSTVEAYCAYGDSFSNAFRSAPTITGDYVVYAGDDAASAVKVDAPTEDTYASKYVRIEPVCTVTVHYGIDGVDDKEIKVAKGETVSLEDPAVDGYRFMGWFADEDLTTAFDFTDPITVDTTVYAKLIAADPDGADDPDNPDGIDGTDSTDSTDSADGTGDADDKNGAVVAIVIGGVALAGSLALLVWLLAKKKIMR